MFRIFSPSGITICPLFLHVFPSLLLSPEDQQRSPIAWVKARSPKRAPASDLILPKSAFPTAEKFICEKHVSGHESCLLKISNDFSRTQKQIQSA